MRRALHSTWLGGRWLVTLWPDYKSTYSVLMTNIILTYWWLGWPDCLDGADEADLTVDGKVVICTIHIQRELLFCFFVKSYFFSNKKITSSAFRHIWCGYAWYDCGIFPGDAIPTWLCPLCRGHSPSRSPLFLFISFSLLGISCYRVFFLTPPP